MGLESFASRARDLQNYLLTVQVSKLSTDEPEIELMRMLIPNNSREAASPEHFDLRYS